MALPKFQSPDKRGRTSHGIEAFRDEIASYVEFQSPDKRGRTSHKVASTEVYTVAAGYVSIP